MRQNSRITVERGDTLNTVSVLRMLTGAVASVWGRGSSRQIVTPTLTAGIRGTGVYTEVLPEQDFRSYFCNCYGTVDTGRRAATARSRAPTTTSRSGPRPQPQDGRLLTPAEAINHTDEELEFLAAPGRPAHRLAGRWAARASKDGAGYMEQQPAAARIRRCRAERSARQFFALYSAIAFARSWYSSQLRLPQMLLQLRQVLLGLRQACGPSGRPRRCTRARPCAAGRSSAPML